MRILFFLLFCSFPLWGGCSSSEKQAAQLLDTAQFEEKQHNLDHASQLYDEIVKKYPSTSAAKDATLRLADLRRRSVP